MGKRNFVQQLRGGLQSAYHVIKRSSLFAITLVLIGMVVIASIVSPYFLDKYNLLSLVRNLAFVGLIGIAQSLLLLVGELDLSVGKVASLCGILAGMLMVNYGINPYLSMAIALVLGFVFGLINGLLITKLRLNALVATIGMAGVYGGVNLVLTKGKAIPGIPEQIHVLGKGNIVGIPIPFLFTLVVMVLVVTFVRRTKMGRYVYAIGNNREAARILGIPVNRIRTVLYAIVGMISALAGTLYVARLGSSQSAIGESWPMNSIAAAVIGGIALTGGVGNPAGALVGAAIISVISNLIVLLGVSVYWQSAVSGIVVVLAITFSSLSAIIQENRQNRS
ncbi:MAG: ABC transporter permease [Spirochaetaceae bacterium]|nr:ABC transporter permease [Spirochaetaceae bacterium]